MFGLYNVDFFACLFYFSQIHNKLKWSDNISCKIENALENYFFSKDTIFYM